MLCSHMGHIEVETHYPTLPDMGNSQDIELLV